MSKRVGIIGLFLIIALMGIRFSQSPSALAFPQGSSYRNLTVNPSAVPSGGYATVTVSYVCGASGCHDNGGLGQLTVFPAGMISQVSSCSFGALGNSSVPGSYPCFDGNVSNSGTVNYGGQGLPSSQLLVSPPGGASPGPHVLQAVLQANGASPGSTLTVCYQSEPVSSYVDPRSLNGTYNPSTDIYTLISRSIPPGDPPSTIVDGAEGAYASLCVFVLVTSGSAQHITLLDVTRTNVNVGGRAIVRALITDQNGNPIPGVNVSFSVSDPSQASLTCATTQDLLASGYTFNPIFAGSYPGPAGYPSAGALANPGAGIQAGQTTLGSPFPVTTASTTTLQATPIGSTCYSGTALGGTTGLGTIPPGAVTALTDNTGVAYVTLVGLASAAQGAGVVVTATVFDGGIPPTGISARSTPYIITGASVSNATGSMTITPTSITSPSNSVSVRGCFNSAGLPVAEGTVVVFTLVEKSGGVVDVAFAQSESGDQNQQVNRSTGADGCATANVVATGSGSVTVSTAAGTSVATATIPVGTGGTSPGLTGVFTVSPGGNVATCPASTGWLGVYWQGANSPMLTAAQACPSADRVWVRRGETWYGAAPDQPGASDQTDLVGGEFSFLHGRP